MTLQAMLEIVKQVFPEKQETQIKIDLNSAYRLYSEETRLPFTTYDVTVSEEQKLVTGSVELDASLGAYYLPVEVTHIVSCAAFDAHDRESVLPDYKIEYSGRAFTILTLDGTVFKGSGLPSGISYLRFGCSLYPEAMSDDTDEPQFIEAFHQALVDQVLTKYFGMKGILQQSAWFRSSYQSYVQSGKKYFNRISNNMDRFSLQNVKDTDVNRVLRQVQDSLNKLADALTLQEKLTDKQVQTRVIVDALSNLLAQQTSGSTTSVRARIDANTWTRILFPGVHAIVPNYQIICRAVSDYNREVYYELRELSVTGFEIWVPEECLMQLDTSKVTEEITGTAVEG